MRVGLTLVCFPEKDKILSYVPPLGLGYLASYVKKHMPEVEVVIERDPRALVPHRPDLVGLTFVTACASYAAKIARRLKEELNCPILVGGPHASTLRGVLDPAFDIAVVGEGEETFLELLRLWKATGKFDPQDLVTVKGIAFHNPAGPGVVETPQRPLIQDLASLPFPDRAIMHGKWSQTKGGYTNIMSSRGCPYECAFCSTTHIWGRKFRYAPTEYVVEEIEDIVRNYEPAEVMFFDDLFIVRTDRVAEISRQVRERGLHQGNRFRASARPNLLNDEVMEAMRAMNIFVLNVGFESSSARVLEKLNKRGNKVEDNVRAVELARKHGMRYASCFILGTPGETREDILRTFDFVLSNADVFEDAQFTPLYVLPSTRVWQWAGNVGIDEQHLTGVVLDEEDIADEDTYLRTRWPYLNEENMPREELIQFYRTGEKIQSVIRGYAASRPLVEPPPIPSTAAAGELEDIAERVPIADILKAKAQRRLRNLIPKRTERIGPE